MSSEPQPAAPPAPAIRGVIFDFGNVVCTFDNERIVAALASACGRPPEGLRDLILGNPQLGIAYESGVIGSRDFLAAISTLCGYDFPEAVFIPAFTEIFTPIETTFDLIRRLKPRYRLGLLSNTNPWHFEHGIRPTPVFPLFDAVTLSYEVGAMKPDPRLYADAAGKLGLPPSACVFIDDIPAFAEGASIAGMQGLTYTGPEALEAGLRRLGVTL